MATLAVAMAPEKFRMSRESNHLTTDSTPEDAAQPLFVTRADHGHAGGDDDSAGELTPASDSAAVDESGDVGPLPIQFRLKGLLGAIAVASLLFALMMRLSIVWGVAVGWAALLIAAHVAANAFGTHATEHAPRRRLAGQAKAPVDPRQAVAPTTTLGGSKQMGISLIVMVVAGAIVGAVVGTPVIWRHNEGRLGIDAVVLACIASAVIGAFLFFLAGSCVKVATRAFHAASRHHTSTQRLQR